MGTKELYLGELLPDNLPVFVTIKPLAAELFCLLETTYTYNRVNKIYTFMENSGIIRSGFTVEFFINHKEHFTWQKE